MECNKYSKFTKNISAEGISYNDNKKYYVIKHSNVKEQSSIDLEKLVKIIKKINP